jgi:hypothetical protein
LFIQEILDDEEEDPWMSSIFEIDLCKQRL